MPAPVLDATSGLLAFIRDGCMPNHLEATLVLAARADTGAPGCRILPPER